MADDDESPPAQVADAPPERGRWDVIFPIQRKSKTRWAKLGVAFSDEKGFTVYLDALPFEFNGKFYLRPAKEKPAAAPRVPGKPAWQAQPKKVHFRNESHPRKGICGCFAGQKNLVTDAALVTCKLCLGELGKQRAFDPTRDDPYEPGDERPDEPKLAVVPPPEGDQEP